MKILSTHPMHSRYRLSFISMMLAVFAILPLGATAQIAGFHFRMDEWQGRAIRVLGIRYPEAGIFLHEQPYSRKDMARLLIAAEKSRDQGITAYYKDRLLTYLRPPASAGKKDYYGEIIWRNEPSYSEHINPNESMRFSSDVLGYIQIGQNLSGYFDFQGDTDGAFDAEYHGEREWKNLAGDMRAAFFQYNARNWEFLLGREYVHWGPGTTGALLTSGHAPALDMFKLTLHFGHFRFQGFNALLNASKNEISENINRYFSGHRMSARWDHYEFGISETVMNGGPNRNVYGAYLNFLIPYYLTDVMNAAEKRKDNVTVALDAAVYWPAHMRFYGQLVVDEYYYEGEDYPKRTGCLAGFAWTQAFSLPALHLNVEYARMDRWLYNYESHSPWNRLNYFNSLLGHPLGPDADILQVQAEIYPGKQMLIQPFFKYIRCGETRIDTPLITADQLNQHHPPFPYGTVESSAITGLYLEYVPHPDWIFSGFLQYLKMDNSGNQKGASLEEVAYRLGVRHDLRVVF